MNKIVLISLSLILMLFSCAEEKPPKREKREKPQSAKTREKPPQTAKPQNNNQSMFFNPSFSLEPLTVDDNPASIVRITVANHEHVVDTLLGEAEVYETDIYTNMEIPKGCVSACGSWWETKGTFYHALLNPQGMQIFKGWRDKAQTDYDFHWEAHMLIKYDGTKTIY